MRADMGEGFQADVLTERSLRQLLKQAPERLLIVGRKFANEVELPLDKAPASHRCVIVSFRALMSTLQNLPQTERCVQETGSIDQLGARQSIQASGPDN